MADGSGSFLKPMKTSGVSRAPTLFAQVVFLYFEEPPSPKTVEGGHRRKTLLRLRMRVVAPGLVNYEDPKEDKNPRSGHPAPSSLISKTSFAEDGRRRAPEKDTTAPKKASSGTRQQIPKMQPMSLISNS